MGENNNLQHRLVNDVYAELGTISKHSQDVIDYLMRHGWIRAPEEAEAAARGQMPGRTITETEFRDAFIGTVSFDGWTKARRSLGRIGVTVVPEQANAEHTRDWWVEEANVNDAEDCEACEGDLCPVHYGISVGIDLMAKKIAALSDDPELFALIPDPVTAPRGESDG